MADLRGPERGDIGNRRVTGDPALCGSASAQRPKWAAGVGPGLAAGATGRGHPEMRLILVKARTQSAVEIAETRQKVGIVASACFRGVLHVGSFIPVIAQRCILVRPSPPERSHPYDIEPRPMQVPAWQRGRATIEPPQTVLVSYIRTLCRVDAEGKLVT
jgi:hypothetical protein